MITITDIAAGWVRDGVTQSQFQMGAEKMINIVELSQRILSELEEAGEENILCLLNTTIRPTGLLSEIRDLRETLAFLVQRDLIVMSLENLADGLVKLDINKSLQAIDESGASFTFDKAESSWNLSRDVEIPCAVLTPQGRSHANEIVRSRGHDWWLESDDLPGL